jgi:hypothetical protein
MQHFCAGAGLQSSKSFVLNRVSLQAEAVGEIHESRIVSLILFGYLRSRNGFAGDLRECSSSLTFSSYSSLSSLLHRSTRFSPFMLCLTLALFTAAPLYCRPSLPPQCDLFAPSGYFSFFSILGSRFSSLKVPFNVSISAFTPCSLRFTTHTSQIISLARHSHGCSPFPL